MSFFSRLSPSRGHRRQEEQVGRTDAAGNNGELEREEAKVRELKSQRDELTSELKRILAELEATKKLRSQDDARRDAEHKDLMLRIQMAESKARDSTKRLFVRISLCRPHAVFSFVASLSLYLLSSVFFRPFSKFKPS